MRATPSARANASYSIRKMLLFGAVVSGVLFASWGIWSRWLRQKVSTPVASTPSLPASPYLNVQADVQYVGDETCGSCHPSHTRSFHQHPMGRSLAPSAKATPIENYQDARLNPFAKFGFSYQLKRNDGRLLHKESRPGPDGSTVGEIEVEAEYAIGSGARGRSYLIDHDGYLFQSPISWFSQKAIWDLSPGYTPDNHAHFERPITPECLFCHANRVEPVAHTMNRYEKPIFRGYSIGCERCHGPGDLHVRARQNGEVPKDIDYSIVNPGRLEPALREAVCQQCHLKGAVRVLRRDRETFDFRPGLPLEHFWRVFATSSSQIDNKLLSQVEQMYLSRCFRASSGKMGCISCHDPHKKPPPEKAVAYFRDRCLTCHQDKSCSLPVPIRRKRNKEDSCVTCHMPPINTSNIAHTAITDHRILREPGAPPAAENLATRPRPGQLLLAPFHPVPPDEPNKELDRDLGVALAQRSIPRSARDIGAAALPRLEAALEMWPDDLPAWDAKGQALWLLGRLPEALQAFESCLDREPNRHFTLMDAAHVSEALGRRQQAIAYWQRLLAEDPWPSAFHFELARLLAQDRNWQRAALECEAALARNPAEVGARKLLVACYVGLGRKDEARTEFEKVLAFEPGQEESLRRWYAQLLGR